MRRNLMRRMGLVLLGLFFLVFGASALAVALFTRTGGRHSVAAALTGGLVLLAFVALVVARAIRRLAVPLADVMEAAGRVAGGDYAARVEPRGSREVRALGRAFNAMAARLQANEEQRRNLLADVAHELRTPLSVIRANAEGLMDGLYPADHEHLAPIVEETQVLARLLDDLATLSTAEAGALTLHREPVEPRILVEDAVAAFRARAEVAGVTVESGVDAALPEIEVDPVRIREVLANLLSNALRHTPSGGAVTVRAERLDPRSGVAFVVRDTGAGIAANELPHVFERFTKSPGSKGAGLGLAIARTLVEAHGGSIAAESRPGTGTTVRFVLPPSAA